MMFSLIKVIKMKTSMLTRRMNSYIVIFVTLICLSVVTISETSNILAFLPTFSASHLIMEMTVIRAMAERQHNVTLITTLAIKPEWLHPNIRHIQLDKGHYDLGNAAKSYGVKGLKRFLRGVRIHQEINYSLSEIMDDPKMQNLINNRDNHFDLMIYGYIFSDYFLGLGHHFDCPIALLWPNIPIQQVLQLIGNPLELSYAVSSIFYTVTDGSEGFQFRFQNVMSFIMESVMSKWQLRFTERFYEKHFPAEKYASFEKAKERVSMVLYSHHFSEKPVRPLVPGLIEIGGIHLNEEPNPLPKDIAEFIESAEDGIIFFSLGTNIKAKHLKLGVMEKIYNVLSKLPLKILWKCDDSDVPGNSTNILFQNWLPQPDILGHPNVKLFFGHGGKGGITEAKFYGVPMVGLPLFGDQPMNMEEVVRKGYGLSIPHNEEISEDIIHQTIMEVLHNTTYSNNVKLFSKIYRDRPMKPKDTAVYWLEYLIRHRGAPQMQSPSKTMSLIEKTNIDVMIFLLLIFILVLIFIKYFILYIVKLIFRLLQKKTKRE